MQETAVNNQCPPGSTPRVLLAFETSGQRCSVALARLEDDRIITVSLAEDAGQDHSRICLAMAKQLLSNAQLGLSHIDAIAFDAGPGSFTGLRIGCGIAQGLGFALNRPLICVGSLEALAWRAQASQVLVASDARMQEVYVGAYHVRDDQMLEVHKPQVLAASAAVKLFEQQLVTGCLGKEPALIGDGFARYPELAQFAQHHGLTVRADVGPDADSIARIAWLRYLEGRVVNAAQAAPLYVRDKVALDVDEQQKLRQARAAAG